MRFNCETILFSFFTLLFISACGKETKTGAVELSGSANPNSNTVQTSTSEFDSNSNDSSTDLSLPLVEPSELSTPETKQTLNEMISPVEMDNFLRALDSLENPQTMQATSDHLAKSLALLHLIVQKADEEANKEFIKLLQIIAKEVDDLKKNFSKAKLKKFAKKTRGRIAGIAKRAAKRHKAKRH